MALLTLKELKSKPSLRFPEGNRIGFWMDFSYWQGIPSDREFYIVGTASNDHLDLVAEGYGLKESYGNGSIYVDHKDLLYIRIPGLV